MPSGSRLVTSRTHAEPPDDTGRPAGGIALSNIPIPVANTNDWYGYTWSKVALRPTYYTLIETETSFAELSPGEPRQSLVKSLTGGDPIRARRMREDFWEFIPTHKVWLSTNHKPVIRGTDHAIWRRILLIPFTVQFSNTSLPRKDPRMESQLMAELPGILGWAVRGCLAWQRDGLNPPDVVKAVTAEYRAHMDALAAFLEECCLVQADAKAKASGLYQTYTQWCDQNGERPENQRSFGMRLSERGFERFKVRGLAWWRGLSVVDHVDDVDQ